MTKLTLQEQMLKAGLVSSKKMAKVQRTAKKSRVQAREAREAVEENKKAQVERDKQLSEQQKQAALSKEYKAQIKQLIEMNKITITRGDIGYNFTDNNLIKKVYVDKVTQAQLIKGRLAIARLTAESSSDSEYAIIPAVVADKIAVAYFGERQRCHRNTVDVTSLSPHPLKLVVFFAQPVFSHA